MSSADATVRSLAAVDEEQRSHTGQAASPFVTWSRMSGTMNQVVSISTPRLMGPGCMISASGFVRAGQTPLQAKQTGVFANSPSHRLPLALVLAPPPGE